MLEFVRMQRTSFHIDRGQPLDFKPPLDEGSSGMSSTMLGDANIEWKSQLSTSYREQSATKD